MDSSGLKCGRCVLLQSFELCQLEHCHHLPNSFVTSFPGDWSFNCSQQGSSHILNPTHVCSHQLGRKAGEESGGDTAVGPELGPMISSGSSSSRFQASSALAQPLPSPFGAFPMVALVPFGMFSTGSATVAQVAPAQPIPAQRELGVQPLSPKCNMEFKADASHLAYLLAKSLDSKAV